MLPLHRFPRTIRPEELPRQLNNPFSYTPHPLCTEAARLVEEELDRLRLTERERRGMGTETEGTAVEGKMMGVLVVETPEGEVGFLAAFSGLLMGRSVHPWFVPPIFDPTLPEGYFRREEAAISGINERIQMLQQGAAYREAREDLKQAMEAVHAQLAALRQQLSEHKAARRALRQQGTLAAEDEARLIRESQHQKAEFKRKEQALQQQLEPLKNRVALQEETLQRLKQERKSRSAALQQWLFEQYVVNNGRGEQTTIWKLFTHPEKVELTGLTRQAPPGGTGDCAAPKLLQFAYLHGLRPRALAEWWWGPSPLTEVHTHGTFYPACRGKCGPLLAYMLQGLSCDYFSSSTRNTPPDTVEILYEDATLAVVVKPAGLCSVPGTDPSLPSLYQWARQHYPQAEGALLVHRLDMDTSGGMLLALPPEAHRQLQQQFAARTVEKRYEALLQGALPAARGSEGTIDLPLCLDPYDRPRQMVHPLHGKAALTRYQVLQCEDGRTRIAFYPLTGRTHQLRVHAAHPAGLGLPILGDRLYGQPAQRLYLHAASLSFTHPITGERLHFESPAPF